MTPPRPGARNLITDVPGLCVGNARDDGIKTGVTVLLGDRPMVAGVHVMGGAPGTRETDLLAPDKTVQEVDALVLSGGSAFGLDAASGAADWLRGQGRGFAVGDQLVPIVPGAIVFDLINGGDGIDMVSYWTAVEGVTADMLDQSVNTGEAAGDTYVELENLNGSSHDDILRGDNANNGIWGAAGDDLIEGRGGNDTLNGHLGMDTLDGGAGNDLLQGGSEADTFVFTEGADTVQSFENDLDLIQIDDALWGGGAISTAQLIDRYATVVNGNTVLDFGGGDRLTISGLGNPDLLLDDIVIF